MPQGTLSGCFASIHLVDIETCSECDGGVKVIACIDDSNVTRMRLDHLREKAGTKETTALPAGQEEASIGEIPGKLIGDERENQGVLKAL